MAYEDTAELEALLDATVPRLRERLQTLTRRRHRPPTIGAALVWTHGVRALQSAYDHLAAWQALAHVRPRRVMAHYSLLRTVVDGASRARWLFDPRVSAGVRASRGYRSELNDREEVVKVDKLDERDRPDSSAPPDALEQDLRDEATAEGVQIPSRRKSAYSLLAASYATFPSRYKGSGAYLYSILSAAAHGHVWAEHLTRQAILREPDTPDVPIHIMDPETALWATRIVLSVLEKAVSEAEAHGETNEPGTVIGG